MLNEHIFAQSRIRFISGARTGNFPIIDGPRPNGNFIYNELDPNDTRTGQDRDRAVNKCRLAWREKDPAVTGMVAVNINRFIDTVNLAPTNEIYGIARIPRNDFLDVGDQILQGVATISDRAYFYENREETLPSLPSIDSNEKWFGHEIGHGLSLIHLQDGVNLMENQEILPLGTILLADQITQIRTHADLIPDRTISLSPGPNYRGSTWPDNIDDRLYR